MQTEKTTLSKRRKFLYGVFAALLTLAILVLTLDVYRKSAIIDTLFGVYKNLAQQVSPIQNVSDIDTQTLDLLANEVDQLNQNLLNLDSTAVSVQSQPISAGTTGPAGVAGQDGINGINGIDGTDGVASCPNGTCVSLQAAPSIQESGYVYLTGVVANTFDGNGSALDDLDASKITVGQINTALLHSSVTLLGNTFNGNSQLVQTTGGGALPALSAANLTSLNASQLTSGTVSDARLSSNVTLQGNSFNSSNQLVMLNGSGALPAVSGANLTNLPTECSVDCVDLQASSPGTAQTGNINVSGAILAATFAGSGTALTALNASNVASGTLADARLSSNVTLQGNIFNGSNQLVMTTGGGALPVISGENLTNLNAASIAAGTLSNSRLSSSVTLQGNSFNGASQLVQLNGSSELPAVSGANLTNLPACGDCVELQASSPGTTQTGHFNISGTALAGTFSGSGANLTSLNASNISSGALADARLSGNVTLQGNTFNGNSQLVQTTAGGILPVISGANLTNLNASNASSGTLADARLSGNVTLQGNSFNAAGQLVQLNGSSQLPAVSGALLTNLNATSVSLGTLADGRLSTNVTLLGNTFNSANQLVQLNGSGLLPALNGSALTNLNASNISSGTLADARLSSNVALLDRDSQSFTGDNAIFRNDNNSATAFDVRNAAGSSIFTVDTQNNEATANNLIASSSLVVGSSGSTVSQIRYFTPTINPANVPAASTSEQTFTVTGLATTDTVFVNKPTLTSGCGIIGARVSAADTLAISWVNVLGILGCDPPSEVYKVMAIRAS